MTGYSKEQHFLRAKETTAAVRPYLLAEPYVGVGAEHAVFSEHMGLCLNRRLKKQLLRPLLARLALEVGSDVSWETHLPIFAAVELLNISTYQSNYCFDEKAGVTGDAAKNNQFICSMISLSAAGSLVNSAESISDFAKSRILARLAEVNRDVYLGQFLDLNVLHFDQVEKFSNMDEYSLAYIRRCDLIAGSTFRACGSGAIAAECSVEIQEQLDLYLSALGAATQVINDLGDYISTITKDYAVPGSDLMLGRLTLPAYLMHLAGVPLMDWQNQLRRGENVDSLMSMIEQTILELRLEVSVREFVKLHYFPQIRESIHRLGRLVGAKKAAPLRFAYPYIYDSRLLRYFRKDRERAWPTAERNRG